MPVPVAAASAAPPTEGALARELELLGHARSALKSGDAPRALSELDRYASNPGPKRLGSEATLLRVRALLGLGRRSEAEALVSSYLARHPNDAYARKLGELVQRAR